MEVSLYRVRVRFEKLFADPSILEGTENLVRRHFVSTGIASEKTDYLHQATSPVAPVDDSGKPSVVAGTAKYRYDRKRVRSEYMSNANLEFDYVDFGSGLTRDDHVEVWNKARWGEMRFEVKEFHHETATIDLPDVAQLFQMLKVRADPTTMGSVELPKLDDYLFHATVRYLAHELKRLAELEGGSVEVYAARDLGNEERLALERRLPRESTASTVHVILTRTTAP